VAISYSNLFADLGKLVKHYNEVAVLQAGFVTRRTGIEDQFESTTQLDKVANLLNASVTAASSMKAYRSQLVDMATLRLCDQSTILGELDISTASFTDVIRAFIAKMALDTASIDASVVTIGTVTAAAGNVGNGSVYCTKVLDGATAPGAGMAIIPTYAGVNSELSLPQTMTVECIADSYSNGRATGSERFSVNGENAAADRLDQPELGSGVGPTTDTVATSTIISNGTFESFPTTNTPASWTIAAGVVTDNILKDATNFYRGQFGLKLLGDGVATAITLTQVPTTMIPLKRYLVSFRYKASATQTSGQTFEVKFTGTGYTAPAGQKSTILGDVLATTSTLVTFEVLVPANRPTDWKLSISISGTPVSTKYVTIDDVFVAPLAWHNGLGFAVIPGSTPFVKGDKFTTAITNNVAGDFQEFFRRNYGVQLPSNNAGAETIADTLAA
jgi:hypothetical protein